MGALLVKETEIALARMNAAGWVLFPRVLSVEQTKHLSCALDRAYFVNRKIQLENGVGDEVDGSVAHLPLIDDIFVDFLEGLYFDELLKGFFGGAYILNTFGGITNLPHKLSYVGSIHRDQRTYSGDFPLMAQLIIMLDDFTLENGATYLLDGSHRQPDKPDHDFFYANATRMVAPSGSVVLFNSNLWHAAGVNRSSKPRRCLTLAFSKPFMKQQLDYPRALGYERAPRISETLRQILGYNALVPSTLDEWYQPLQRRFYKRGQG